MADCPVNFSVSPSEDCPVDHRVSLPVDLPVDHKHDCPVSQPTAQSTERSTLQPTTFPTVQPTLKSAVQSPSPSTRQPLTEKQAIVYYCLKWLAGEGTTIGLISRATGINPYTIKNSLYKMRKSGHISEYRGMVNIGGRIGFSAIVADFPIILQGDKRNVESVLRNLDWPKLLLTQPIYFGGEGQFSSRPLSRLDDPLGNLLPASLSSRRFLEKPSSKGLLEVIQEIFDTDPELDYWLQKGLTSYQMHSRLTETGTELEILVASLRHAAFDLKDLRGEQTRSIKRPLDYFYSIYRKNRFLAPPSGYKSHKQKEIEFREEVRRQKEAEEKRLMELEIEDEFEAMMNNPEGELYKHIEAKLNRLARSKDNSSPVRRSAMRKIYLREVVMT